MQIEHHPDVSAFRSKVADNKDLDLYSDLKAKAMLEKILNVVK